MGDNNNTGGFQKPDEKKQSWAQKGVLDCQKKGLTCQGSLIR